MKTQLLYKVQMFFVDIYSFFPLTSIKRKTIYEKTQNTTVHVYSAFVAIKKQMTKGTCIILHSVSTDKGIRHKRDYL